MAQQTAVEWLEQEFNNTFYVAQSSEIAKRFERIFEQAKQMEKEKVELRYKNGSPMRKYNSPKLQAIEMEILDEEILKAAKECVYKDLDISVGSFELGARWYREQLKKK